MPTSNSGAKAKSAVLVSDARQVMQVGVDNTAAATDYYLMLFHASALPADGTVPDLEKFAPRASHTSLDWQQIGGVRFPKGLVAALSSTPASLTLATSADGWFQAVYF